MSSDSIRPSLVSPGTARCSWRRRSSPPRSASRRCSSSRAVTGYLLIVSDAGLSAFAVREMARERTLTPRLGWPVVVVQTAVAGVLYALLIAGLLLSGLS